MNKDKLQHYSYLTVTVIGAGVLLYILIEHLFFVILPFLIAWAVAFTVRPLAHKISEKTHVSHKLVSALLTISFVVGGIAMLVGAIVYGVGQSWNFLSGLAEDDELYNMLLKIMNPISGILGDSDGAAELEARIGDAVKNALTSVLSQILGALTTFASSVPRAFIFLLVTVIGSVYFSLDLDNINMFLRERLPKKIFANLVNFKKNFLSAVLKYLRSYNSSSFISDSR